jgi:pilus assembly protein CpaC
LAQVQTAKRTEQFQQQAGQSKREDKSVGDVINLLQVGGAQQVMLEIKVAEINRTEVKRLDAQFNSIARGLGNFNIGGVNGGATFPPALFVPQNAKIPVFPGILNSGLPQQPWGPAITEFLPTTATIQNQGLFASYLSKSFLFNLALDAAKEQGLARILAEPTLTTLSGQEATFVSGGEFPIPVPQGLNSITIVFKQYGIAVKFLPVVLNSGHINLTLNVSVSELESGNTVNLSLPGTAANFVIPSLTERSATGVVELSDGQTIGLAGMLHETTRSLVTKFPGLGSIPVLGALFRSQSYQKGETELVILVTPRLARPLPPGKVRMPTDSYVEPTDTDFFFRGHLEHNGPKTSAAPPSN